MKFDCSCYCDYPNFNHYHKNGTWKCVDRYINIDNHEGYKRKTHCKNIYTRKENNQMNKVELVGRLTKDPESKLTSNQTNYCNFTIAVDRRFKDANGEHQADFINCVAWRQTAEFVQKYFKKGNRIGVCGSIQTRNYEDDSGTKHYITEVLVDEAEFVESANKTEPTTAHAPIPDPEEPSGELPFEL